MFHMIVLLKNSPINICKDHIISYYISFFYLFIYVLSCLNFKDANLTYQHYFLEIVLKAPLKSYLVYSHFQLKECRIPKVLGPMLIDAGNFDKLVFDTRMPP